MRIRTLVVTLALAAPLVALENGPAAACDWGWGRSYGYAAPVTYGSYGYAPRTYRYYGYAPRTYGYYGYAPRYYGGFYGRRWGWRGYGYRGWRGYGYRGWRGAHVAGFRGGLRGGFHGRR